MSPERVPKILGADVELGNHIDGLDATSGTGALAARLLLREIPGVMASRAAHAQDSGRRFLPANGGSAYIDLNHLELASPETLSAFDFVAYAKAMLRIAREAVGTVNARMPGGRRVRAIANCSDGHGQSYGAHMSVLTTRAAWDAIVRRKPHVLSSLAAYQASSIVFSGAGKVGAENGRPAADFQLSQRADFLETMLGEQTTFNRPLVNARDEALCGSAAAGHDPAVPPLARLHVIFFDATLCQAATLLRAGTLQIVTSMLEAGCVPVHLALDDPLYALQVWSRDPALRARARLVSGEAVTAVQLQQRFLEYARECAATIGFDGLVPRAGEILDLWDDTLQKLHARDYPALSQRLDWVLKLRILERAMARRPSLGWTSPELRHLDQIYASLDEAESLFSACEQAGDVGAVVPEASILRAVSEPPDDTRAWTRAQLLRRAGEARIEGVDWDCVAFRLDDWGRVSPWSERRTVHLPNPFAATKQENAAVFTPDRPLHQVLEALLADGAAATPYTH